MGKQVNGITVIVSGFHQKTHGVLVPRSAMGCELDQNGSDTPLKMDVIPLDHARMTHHTVKDVIRFVSTAERLIHTHVTV